MILTTDMLAYLFLWLSIEFGGSESRTYVNKKTEVCPNGVVYREGCKFCYCIEDIEGFVHVKCESKYTKAKCPPLTLKVHCNTRRLLYDYKKECEGECSCNEARNVTTCENLPCDNALLSFLGYYEDSDDPKSARSDAMPQESRKANRSPKIRFHGRRLRRDGNTEGTTGGIGDNTTCGNLPCDNSLLKYLGYTEDSDLSTPADVNSDAELMKTTTSTELDMNGIMKNQKEPVLESTISVDSTAEGKHSTVPTEIENISSTEENPDLKTESSPSIYGSDSITSTATSPDGDNESTKDKANVSDTTLEDHNDSEPTMEDNNAAAPTMEEHTDSEPTTENHNGSETTTEDHNGSETTMEDKNVSKPTTEEDYDKESTSKKDNDSGSTMDKYNAQESTIDECDILESTSDEDDDTECPEVEVEEEDNDSESSSNNAGENPEQSIVKGEPKTQLNYVNEKCPHGIFYRFGCRACYCFHIINEREPAAYCTQDFDYEVCKELAPQVHCEEKYLLYDYDHSCEGSCKCERKTPPDETVTTCEYLPCNDMVLRRYGYYDSPTPLQGTGVGVTPGVAQGVNIHSYTRNSWDIIPYTKTGREVFQTQRTYAE